MFLGDMVAQGRRYCQVPKRGVGPNLELMKPDLKCYHPGAHACVGYTGGTVPPGVQPGQGAPTESQPHVREFA